MTHRVKLTIKDLARGGSGVADLPDGRIAFVPFTLPGDVIEAEIIKEHKNYVQTELVQIVVSASARVEPKCPVFQKCGGCTWQHVPYPLQWETKLKGIQQVLKRVGIASIPIESFEALDPWNYRNRMQFRGDGNQIGMFERESRSLIAVERCDIARAEINEALAEIRSEGSKLPPPYKVEVEILEDGKIQTAWNSKHAAYGFRQVNDAQNERLKEAVAKRVTTSETVFDLFGGAGNLSLPLAGRVREIHCVDSSSPKTRPKNTPSNLHFYSKPVLNWVRHQAPKETGKPVHSAIIDPPREGIGRDIQELDRGLKKMGVIEIVAVGCDIDSWSSDLRRWLDAGWKIRSLAAVDLFPQTPHVEAIAQLYL